MINNINIPKNCIWTETQDGIWETSCSQSHEFFESGPKENKHKFCPYCGLVIAIIEYKYDDE